MCIKAGILVVRKTIPVEFFLCQHTVVHLQTKHAGNFVLSTITSRPLFFLPKRTGLLEDKHCGCASRWRSLRLSWWVPWACSISRQRDVPINLRSANTTDLSSCPYDDATLIFSLGGDTTVDANTVSDLRVASSSYKRSPARRSRSMET